MLTRIPPRHARLPRHAKAFAMPIRLSPAERKLLGVTQPIRDYVAGFKARGKLDLARKIVEDIRSFRQAALHLEEAKAIWAKRSAEEIIRSRQIVIMTPAEAALTKKPAIIGCTDAATAITAAMRAIGLQALIVRRGTHAYTKFLYKNRVFIADTRETKRPRVRQMTREDKGLENSYRAANAFAEGKSLAAIGIKSFQDFFKYRYVPRR